MRCTASIRRAPVFVESESKKIGVLRVPEALIAAMWRSETIVLEAGVATRVALLKGEYAHFSGRRGRAQYATGVPDAPARPRHHRALVGHGTAW